MSPASSSSKEGIWATSSEASFSSRPSAQATAALGTGAPSDSRVRMARNTAPLPGAFKELPSCWASRSAADIERPPPLYVSSIVCLLSRLIELRPLLCGRLQGLVLLLHGSVHLAQAAGPGRVPDFAGALPGANLGLDARRYRAATRLDDLAAHVRYREPEAVANWNGVLALLEAHADRNLALRDRAPVVAVVDDFAGRRAAESPSDRQQRERLRRLQERLDGLVGDDPTNRPAGGARALADGVLLVHCAAVHAH